MIRNRMDKDRYFHENNIILYDYLQLIPGHGLFLGSAFGSNFDALNWETCTLKNWNQDNNKPRNKSIETKATITIMEKKLIRSSWTFEHRPDPSRLEKNDINIKWAWFVATKWNNAKGTTAPIILKLIQLL